MKVLLSAIALSLALVSPVGGQQRTTNYQVWHTPNSTTYYNYDTGRADTFYDPSPRREIKPLEPILQPEPPLVPMPPKLRFKKPLEEDDD